MAACVAATAAPYERATGGRLAVETAALFDVASTDGADVVVAADQELNRIIEGGGTHPDLDVDVARIPWVLAGASAAGATGAPGARADDDARAGHGRRRRARGVAQPGPPGRSPRTASRACREPLAPLQLEAGEAAVVPLSLAGSLPVQSLDIPPLTARALGVRSSARTQAIRAYLDFLVGEKGNAAFRACGRTDGR